MRRLFVFGIVGGIGFVVDGGILSLLASVYGLDIYLSRAVSFLVAVFLTWLLNRTFVFDAAATCAGTRSREYARYLVVQVTGALLNLAMFVALIRLYPMLKSIPILPLAAGSAAAMVFNFAGSRYWVFQPVRPSPTGT